MRLFAAIDLPKPVRSSLSAVLERLRPAADIRWSPVENLHVTTKFIGEWPENRLGELAKSLSAVKDGPFPVTVSGLGWFPNPHRPRIFWAAVHAGEPLMRLAKATDAALTPLGIAAETKPYQPHLTLARIKDDPPLQKLRQAVAQLESADFGEFVADRFFLYLSKPGAGGSVYTPLEEFPL